MLDVLVAIIVRSHWNQKEFINNKNNIGPTFQIHEFYLNMYQYNVLYIAFAIYGYNLLIYI